MCWILIEWHTGSMDEFHLISSPVHMPEYIVWIKINIFMYFLIHVEPFCPGDDKNRLPSSRWFNGVNKLKPP